MTMPRVALVLFVLVGVTSFANNSVPGTALLLRVSDTIDSLQSIANADSEKLETLKKDIAAVSDQMKTKGICESETIAALKKLLHELATIDSDFMKSLKAGGHGAVVETLRNEVAALPDYAAIEEVRQVCVMRAEAAALADSKAVAPETRDKLAGLVSHYDKTIPTLLLAKSDQERFDAAKSVYTAGVFLSSELSRLPAEELKYRNKFFGEWIGVR